jgi:hypothetical protein
VLSFWSLGAKLAFPIKQNFYFEKLRMVQRYVFWLAFDGSKFSGFAKTATGYGVSTLFDKLIRHILVPKGFTDVACSPGSR